jgi:23S rRNA (cytidine1920-2'-O)/16S rRNA (cytidine1409-2'-O)-methyltransferase
MTAAKVKDLTVDLPQQRLDVAMVARGLTATRSRARDMILRGLVSVDGTAVTKAGHIVAAYQNVALAGGAGQFVSRGAEKLAPALDHFCFPVTGRTGLDIGASTGGFTEILLNRGARKVYAVDVGRGQLHERLRCDERVVSLEATDARALTIEMLPDPVDAVVADVSFISVTKALGPALELATEGAWLIALIKPQFEVGRDGIGKGGIVRNSVTRDRAVSEVRAWLADRASWTVIDVCPSSITGGDGNQEFLIGARKA